MKTKKQKTAKQIPGAYVNSTGTVNFLIIQKNGVIRLTKEAKRLNK